MTTLFSTLGFTAKLAMAPLRDHPNVDTIHLFCGTPLKEEGRAALKAARATADTIGIHLVVHKVKGAFDYGAILEEFSKAYEKSDGDVMVNASGGTRVMTMAATIFCFMHDVPMLYYDEYETQTGKLIPLRAYRRLRAIGESQRAMLRYLRDHGSVDMSTLATKLGLAPSTLSVHVQSLSNDGIVTVERNGKRRIVTLLPEILRVGIEAPATGAAP